MLAEQIHRDGAPPDPSNRERASVRGSSVMHRQLVILVFTAFALLSSAGWLMPGESEMASMAEPAPVVIAQPVSNSRLWRRDEAVMLLLGSSLIALAAAMRRCP